jgi:hypothetical protein
MTNVSGSVLLLGCHACSRVYPHFVLEGETDMQTQGIATLVSFDRAEVLIAELSVEDFSMGAEKGLDALASRLSREFDRDDLRAVHLLRVERTLASHSSGSFQKFLKSYVPPRLVFSCPCCGGGECTSISEMSVADFRRSGGEVRLFGDLVLGAEE